MPGPTADDAAYMRRALGLAARGWGSVHPNPLVGAVVVRDGALVGEGWHAAFGGPHAEVAALEAAGERAQGATLYVTLEPCAHQGKTPPCTNAIAAAGIARLVYAAEDPGRESAGGGARLGDRGLEVLGGVEREAARAQNAAFFHAAERGAPWVALKYALSLDARLGPRQAGQAWVTGEEARAETHCLRAGFDAILVGIGTAIADDPRLTVRGAVTPRVPPARVVLDSEAKLPLASRLVRGAGEAPVRVLCAQDAPRERREALRGAGVEVQPLPRGESGLDVAAALSALWEEGIRSVFVEGGGRTGSSFLAVDRVERLYLFQAPRFYGPDGVPAFTEPLGASGGGDWTPEEVRTFGRDVLLTLRRVHA